MGWAVGVDLRGMEEVGPPGRGVRVGISLEGKNHEFAVCGSPPGEGGWRLPKVCTATEGSLHLAHQIRSPVLQA